MTIILHTLLLILMFCGNLPPSKDKESASCDGGDGAGKVKHRRGRYEHCIIIIIKLKSLYILYIGIILIGT